MTTKAELEQQLEHSLTVARDVSAKAEAEGREYTDEEMTQAREALAKAKEAKDGLLKVAEGQKLRTDLEGLFSGDKAGGLINGSPDPMVPGDGKGSIGDQFAKHVNDWVTKTWGERVPDSVKELSSPPLGKYGMKDLITGVSTTSGGALVTAQDLGLRDTGTFQRPLTLRQMVTNGTTNTDTVEFVRVAGYTNAAAPTAEASAATGTTGTKPESALTFERVSETVKTIAHWVPITRRALSDAGQVRTIVDGLLRYGLEEELEDQMVNGAGTGENFTGISNTTGVQAQAWDTNVLTTTRKARTKVRVVGRANPTAYVMHPNDWETIDLLQDAEQRYRFGGPMELGNPRLWGLPVVECEGCTEGVAYVGDWRQAVLWDREQASVQVGTINDQFIRNMLTILAELRAAFGVFRPEAFVEIDMTAV